MSRPYLASTKQHPLPLGSDTNGSHLLIHSDPIHRLTHSYACIDELSDPNHLELYELKVVDGKLDAFSGPLLNPYLTQ